MQLRDVSWNWLCVMDLDFGINLAVEQTEIERALFHWFVSVSRRKHFVFIPFNVLL
jgi:hypothetical protein